jgi:hypothetical protein
MQPRKASHAYSNFRPTRGHALAVFQVGNGP